MSSEPPEQSPLDRAKAEADELIQKVQDDLDGIRTAPVNELEMRINSLRDSFQASQESAIANVETALKSSDTRIDDLEQNLQAASERITNLKIELASQRLNYVSTKSDLQKAKSELEEANRRAADLQNDHRAVKQRNVGLQAELELAKQQPANLEERLKAVEQQNAGLDTDLRLAMQRASTAEDELKAFKSRFKRINDDMNALASSSEQQLTVTKPVPSLTPPPIARPSVTGRSYAELSRAQPSFALPQHQQGAMFGRKGGPKRDDTSVRTQSLDSHASNSTGDKEPDLLHCQCILNGIMDRAKPLSKCYFFSPVNTDTRAPLTSQNAKLGPVNLSIMKERLARGDYMSSTSFKADFDHMIADCRRLNHPDSGVHTATEDLTKIFEHMWSTRHSCSHKSTDNISQDGEIRSHKRKASTERPVPSAKAVKRAFGFPRSDSHASQPSQPSSSQTRSQQACSTVASSMKTEAGVWKGQVIAGPNIQVDAKVDAVIKRVSVVQPINTFDASCQNLFPDKLEVKRHVTTLSVREELHQLNFSPDLDMVTFRIEQALDAHNKDFNPLFDYFTQRERYGMVDHAGAPNVRKVYLIPVPAGSQYPEYISLDYKELPSDVKQKVLLLVVVFHIKEEAQEQIRVARDAAIKAIRSPDVKDLAGVHKHLKHHPLPIGAFAVSGCRRYMPMLGEMAASHQGFFRLSYPNLVQGGESSIDGVELPKCIFILGRVIGPTTRLGLLVVDMENEDRPLWGISENKTDESRLGRVMMLMRSKFPSSLDEWESTITMELRKTQIKKRLRLKGLKIERYKSSV